MMRLTKRRFLLSMMALSWTGGASFLDAEDWPRFRGENGSGLATNAHHLPTQWSETENLAWKTKLPGPGSSSPIVVGDKVFVTCWSGYGTPEAQGSQADLKRHLVCVDRKSGSILWDKSVAASLPEDSYGGMFAEHGYASHTPTSDGEMVYVFFGKSGVVGFDMDGKQVWKSDVGDGLDGRRWGSACSPLLYKDMLIVLASAESKTIYAFNKKTGSLLWKKAAPNFESTWGTPVLVQTAAGKTELVVGVPGEIWGFDPENGSFLWYCPSNGDDSYCSSVVAVKEVIYSIEGRGGGGIAVRAGGTDDVSKSHILWKNNESNRISSPLVVDGRIYFVNNKIANCLDASTGKQIYKERLPAVSSVPAGQEARPDRSEGRGEGPGGGRGGRRGGGMGGQDYGSPVSGDGKIYYITRSGEMHVFKVGDKFESLGVNRVTKQPEDFSSTPAIADQNIFVRSSHHLYCIGGK